MAVIGFCFSSAVVLVALIAAGHGADLPPGWKKCNPKDPQFNECMKEAVNYGFQAMQDGIPSLNLPTLNPVFIKELHIGKSGAVAIDQTYRNLELHGLRDTVFQEIKFDLEKNELYVTALTKKTVSEGEYEMNGKFLLLNIMGKGYTNATFTNVRAQHILKFEQVKKKGEIYMIVADYKVTFDVDNVHVYFEGLFGNDKAISDSMHNTLNENWQVLWSDTKSSYEQTFSMLYKQFVNQILSKVPMKNLFLQSD